MCNFPVFQGDYDRRTNRPTDQPTDTAYYRDARTHLKIGKIEIRSTMKEEVEMTGRKNGTDARDVPSLR